MNLVAYTRVSKDEQASSGLGLAAQRAAIEASPHPIGYWTEDAGFSGALSPDRRPGLTEALELVHRGLAHGIVVAKLDRLSRKVSDFVELVELSQAEGWALVILDLNVDTSTPNGRFLAHVIASVAQLERDLISQRTTDALAAKRDAGWRHPNATPGAVRDTIVDHFHQGASYRAIALDLNERGIKPPIAMAWRPSSVRSALIAAGEVKPGRRRESAASEV